MRKWIIGLALLAAMLGLAATLAGRYWIYLPGLLSDWRSPVGEGGPIPFEVGPQRASDSPRPPNIVLILADDLGYNDVSLHGGGVGGGRVATPNIDAIASEGVHFTRGYAAHSTCAPSRAALMSGRYGTRFGFEFTPVPDMMGTVVARLHNGNPDNIHPVHIPEGQDDASALPFEDMGMPRSEITLADLLTEHGYHSIHIGKWHLGHSGGSAPIDQGFAESLNMASGLYLPVDDPEVLNSRQAFDPIDRFLWANFRHAVNWNEGPRFRPDGYLTDYFTDAAVQAIEANRNRPFFLYLSHWAPHTPLQALRADYEALDHIEDHTERVYAAMMVALDRGVGRVLDALREQGLEEDTLVIFTSDNGGAGYLGLPDVNAPFRGWKLTFFEGGIHVPFFMRWPGVIPAGSQYDRPVHHFDIYGTAAAAAAAGAAMPDDRPMDGVDLLPFVLGEAEGDPHEALFWRAGHYQVVLADGWKLQRAERPRRDWLFHLETDPTEQHDLAAQRPDKVAALGGLLDAHNAEQAEPLWPSLAELPIFIDKHAAEPQQPSDEYVYVPN